MTGGDDEFDDFLKRRKPVFRSPDDLFEPPAELDRVVLRQAREAIEGDRPMRVYRNPQWATPVALAATLVLAFGAIFYAGLPQSRAPTPEVTVQNVAERIDTASADAVTQAPAPAPVARNAAREEPGASGAVTVELSPPMVARREPVSAAAPAPASPAVQSAEARSMADASVTAASAAPSADIPAWRRDPKSWLAEIERLRKTGDTARADAEAAEFKRQQRAYAASPDR